jgi:hypothetical protein
MSNTGVNAYHTWVFDETALILLIHLYDGVKDDVRRNSAEAACAVIPRGVQLMYECALAVHNSQ